MAKKDKIKTYEDACKVLGVEPNEGLIENPGDEGNAANALIKLIRIANALNEGWKPDWDNSREYKYYPWFDFRSKPNGSGLGLACNVCDFVYSSSTVGSRLAFRTSELAEYAGKQFAAIYADMMVLPK